MAGYGVIIYWMLAKCRKHRKRIIDLVSESLEKERTKIWYWWSAAVLGTRKWNPIFLLIMFAIDDHAELIRKRI